MTFQKGQQITVTDYRGRRLQKSSGAGRLSAYSYSIPKIKRVSD
jgi:hypothetical protein